LPIREEIDLYLQDILKMQHMVSDNISHRLTKGELREKFIRRLVQDEFPTLLLKSGILCADTWQSTQGDFLWLKDGARVGNLNLYDLNDCRMFMEIKSSATATELRSINETANNLKQHYTGESLIIVGMFCYGTSAVKRPFCASSVLHMTGRSKAIMHMIRQKIECGMLIFCLA
jgi:hypothetical protein